MAVRLASVWALVFIAIVAAEKSALSQSLPPGVTLTSKSGRLTPIPFYRNGPNGRQIPEALFGGSQAVQLPGAGTVFLVQKFNLTTFRNGDEHDVQLIAQGPECHLNSATKFGWDAGRVEIFTPTTNFYTEGIGFFCAQSNQLLIISNQVQTRIVKSMIKSPLLGEQNTNAPAASNQVIRIFADYAELHYNSNVVTYLGHVHVVDPQMDITSQKMDVYYTTNGNVDRIFWNDDVVVSTTNHGRATGAFASYVITNNTELIQLSGGSSWQNGNQQAQADQFNYEPNSHFLTATNHVRIRWPQNSATAQNAPSSGSTNFMSLNSDFATAQMGQTNGQVQFITAAGDVAITNESDHSHSFSQHANYNRARDLLELTGDPVWQNARMRVSGWALALQLSNKIYHAEGQARLKMRIGETNSASNRQTDQWLYISSSTMNYASNTATFTEPVAAAVTNNGALADTLSSKLLTLDIGPGNNVLNAIAKGAVRAETVPITNEPRRTISCEVLTVRRSPETLRLKQVVAEDNAVIDVITTGTNAAFNRLSGDTIDASFFPETNHVQHAQARGRVTFEQIKGPHRIDAKGDQADYQALPVEQVELSGHPWARTEKIIISDADKMSWDMKANSFNASGLYNIMPASNAVANTSRAPAGEGSK
jgi:lipopolysaccharide export system protein LptA